jgi:drug/metabolite transporter (DMT)-like permease
MSEPAAPAPRHPALPHVALVSAVSLWATVYVAAKSAMEVIPVADLVAFRFTLGAAVLWAFLFAAGERPTLRGIGWRAFAIGVIEPGAAAMLTFWGLKLTSAVSATVIFATIPVVSAAMSRVFLRERTPPIVLAASVLALVGTVLLVADDAGAFDTSLAGDLLVLGTLVFIAACQLGQRRLATHHGKPVIVTAWQLSGAAAAGFAVAPFAAPPEGAFAWVATAPWQAWATLAYIGVMVSAVTFGIYNYALRYHPVARVNLYYTLVAPIGVPLAALLLDEPVSALDLAATLLVVVAVALPAVPELWQRRSA